VKDVRHWSNNKKVFQLFQFTSNRCQ